MSIWMADGFGLFDLSDGQDHPRYVPCQLQGIEFGPEGSIDLWAYLPLAIEHLGPIPYTDVALQVVAHECGRPDLYENGVPFASLKNGTATKYVDDLDTPTAAGILRVHVEGKVVLLGSEKGEQ